MLNNKILVLLLLLFYFSDSLSQNNDYNWVLGYPPNNPDKYFGGVSLNFNINFPSPKYFDTPAHLYQPAALSSLSGKLMCYTNGCRIFDSNNNIIQNGDSISYGGVWQAYCDEYYPGTQNRLLLPWPGDTLKAVLFHTLVADNFQTHYLLYSVIQFDSTFTTGVVIQKNVHLLDIGVSGLITATKHANGRDWWIVVPEGNTNNYFIILLSNSGVKNQLIQEIGSPWGPQEWASQAVFSPSGEKYVRVNPWKGVDILDFDRCAGKFTDILELGPVSEPIEIGCGAAISLDSKFLYVSNITKLYQFDLTSNDVLSSKYLVGIYDGFEDPFPTDFYQMLLAPDGRIFVFSTSGVKSIHIISNPIAAGAGCNFIQHAMQLPAYISIGSLNIPYFKLGPLDNSFCDTTNMDNLPKANFSLYLDLFNVRKVYFTNLSYYNPTNYNWNFGNGTMSNLKEPGYLIYDNDGIFNVCLDVFNEYGSDTSCKQINLETAGGNYEINEKVEFNIYPNPFTGLIYIENKSDYKHAKFTLYSLLGFQLFNINLNELNTIDCSHFDKGAYYYDITINQITLDSGILIRI
jgi:hypothetical protein